MRSLCNIVKPKFGEFSFVAINFFQQIKEHTSFSRLAVTWQSAYCADNMKCVIFQFFLISVTLRWIFTKFGSEFSFFGKFRSIPSGLDLDILLNIMKFCRLMPNFAECCQIRSGQVKYCQVSPTLSKSCKISSIFVEICRALTVLGSFRVVYVEFHRVWLNLLGFQWVFANSLS